MTIRNLTNRFRRGRGAFFVALICGASSVYGLLGDRTIVSTSQGEVRGVLSGKTIAFKGIPYAAPPVGDLRWKPTAPGTSWSGVLQAKEFGSICPQPSPLDPNAVTGNEDCLTLNIWLPDGASATSQLPVLFFIHGGSHMYGSAGTTYGGVTLFDGAYIAEHGPAVVVTINYRLGPLGFLAHPALAKEGGHGGSGNYGYMDQMEALRWVQKNIRGFGGDPSRVLVFGQSAGAYSTSVLLASPLAKGLFSRAAILSTGTLTFTQAQSESVGQIYEKELGCANSPDILQCLRHASVGDIFAKVPLTLNTGGRTVLFGPTIDGYVLPQSPLETFRAGRQNQMPVIIGTTKDEYSNGIQLIYPKPFANEQEYQQAVASSFGGDLQNATVKKILAQYPAAAYPSPYWAMIALASDSDYICPTRQLARALGTHSTSFVGRYVFSHAFDNIVWRQAGAGHGFELYFLFHNFPMPVSASELQFAEAMTKRWTQFADSGNPNDPTSNVKWAGYSAAQDNYLNLDTTFENLKGVRTQACDFWDQLQ